MHHCLTTSINRDPELMDTTPKSLKDSNVNLEVKIGEEEIIGVRSLTCGTLGVKRLCWSSKMRTKKNDKWVNYSYRYAQTK
jgi:hypothetical protein